MKKIFSKLHVKEQDEDDVNHVTNIRMMANEVKSIGRLCTDETLTRKINKLEEVITYSDPVSTPSVSGMDERISNNISILREAVEDNDLELANTRVDRITDMFKERNDKIAALKR